MKKVIFPGTFDPIHFGHINLIERAAQIFDEVIVLLAVSPTKTAWLPLEDRKAIAEGCLKSHKNVRVEVWEGLTIDACKHFSASIILRGVRNGADFEFENSLAQMNQKLEPSIETLLMPTQPEWTFAASKFVREIFQHGGDLSSLVPESVLTKLNSIKKRSPK